MLFRLLGREPQFMSVPISFVDMISTVLDFLARLFPKQLEVRVCARARMCVYASVCVRVMCVSL